MEKEKSCCFTGHRIISAEERIRIAPRLKRAIDRLIEIGVTDFYTGGAIGLDTIAAEAIIAARHHHPHIRLILALPCKNQAERWKSSDVLKYEHIKSLADEIIYMSEKYTRQCMHIRNRFMVDHSAYCISYLKKPSGGTYYTVNYATDRGLIIYNL